MRGSSPLARGLHPGSPDGRERGRIIPARAGFTITALDTLPSAADHPRSRGVYHHGLGYTPVCRGSSPLARGLLRRRRSCLELRGIIPARAGFTGTCPTRPTRHGDHPRSRGVYSTRQSSRAAVKGSSPLARGLLPGLRHRVRGPRIIPARAGFTCGPLGGSFHYWDHPRSRGVYGSLVSSSAVYTGSSPLARGLRTTDTTPGRPTGIIPARAGFTQGGPHTSPSTRDHPRSRGVYVWELLKQTGREGSSPLARGLHAVH